jgi:hypothetical protein
MAAGNTYTKVATQTMTTATATVTFSSIPSTYTDLVLIVTGTTNTGRNFHININSDSGSNYSFTQLSGDGTSASSSQLSNETVLRMTALWAAQGSIILNFFNYSNTTTHKTMTSRTSNAVNQAGTSVGLWRNTSAINRLDFTLSSSDNFLTGTTFTLYGILAA